MQLTTGFSGALQNFQTLSFADRTSAQPLTSGNRLLEHLSKGKKRVGQLLTDTYMDPHAFAHPGEGGTASGTQVAEEQEQKPKGLSQLAQQRVPARTGPAPQKVAVQSAQPTPVKVAKGPAMSID